MLECREYEECTDCRGTGAEDPDCELCKGDMYITVEVAEAHGYSREDVEAEEDGYCRCPRCGAESCSHCEGDGRKIIGYAARQEDRVLLTGLSPHNDIFPEISDYMGRVNIDRDELLSLAAFNRLRDKGCVGTLWVPLVGSDHFNLTGKGWLRALSFFEDGTGKWPRTDEGPEYQYFCDHNLFEWRGAEFVRWP